LWDGHNKDEAVAPGGAGEGQGNAGIAAGGLHNQGAGRDPFFNYLEKDIAIIYIKKLYIKVID